MPLGHDVGDGEGGLVGIVWKVVGRAGLEHVGAEIAVERRVERIHPHDRAAAFMDVLVPGPARRDDEIAFLHQAALAVDDGVGALALDDEADRVHGVAVRARGFSRQEDLQRGREICRGAGRGVVGFGIDEGQNAALDRGRRGHPDGLIDERAQLAPLPQMRPRSAVAGLVGDGRFP